MFKLFGITISASTWFFSCFSMSKVRTTRPICHHGNLHRAGYCKASQPLQKDARWSKNFASNTQQFWWVAWCNSPIDFGYVFVWLLACQILPFPNSLLFRFGNLFFRKRGKRTSPASLVCGSHALPPAFGACTTARLLRFEPPNSTNFHTKFHCLVASPPPPQDALHSVQPLQLPQTQFRTCRLFCKTHQCQYQWICISVQNVPNLQLFFNFKKCFNWSANLPDLVDTHPKDSAPPPLWPRMPWARKYFRCMPPQRGKQEKWGKCVQIQEIHMTL